MIRSIAAVKRFTQHQKSGRNKTNKYIVLVVKLAKVFNDNYSRFEKLLHAVFDESKLLTIRYLDISILAI